MTTTSRSPGVCRAADDVRQQVRVADRHQHAAGTRFDLVGRQLGGEHQVERGFIGAGLDWRPVAEPPR
jgi:hypothetical protein